MKLTRFQLFSLMRYAWFITGPPIIIAGLGIFATGFWSIGYLALAFLIYLMLRSSYQCRKSRVIQHVKNHEDAKTSAEPYVLILRSFSLRGNYSVEESGTLLIAGGTQPVEHHQVNSYVGNIDLALGRSGMRLVVIGTQNLSLPIENRVLMVECPDEQWLANFKTLAHSARAILIVPELTPAVTDEIEYICSNKLQEKSIVIMPPSDERKEKKWWITEINVEKTKPRDERWKQLREVFASRNLFLPNYNPDGALLLIGDNRSKSKNVSLSGEDHFRVFDAAFQIILPALNGRWRPLGEVYKQLIPDEPYKTRDILFDEIPGETQPFGVFYVGAVLIVLVIASATAVTVFSGWLGFVFGFLLFPLGIFPVGAYIVWVFADAEHTSPRKMNSSD